MSLNDQNISNQGVDVYPGVSNPTVSSNISDPYEVNGVYQANEDLRKDLSKRDVIEARPGIIETSHIKPLDKATDPNFDPNKEWKQGSILQSASNKATQLASDAADTVTGVFSSE